MINEGALKAVIDSQFDLSEAGKAQTHLETRRAKGKIVLNLIKHLQD